MSPKRNRDINDIYEQKLEQRIMARTDERFNQIVDQLDNQMNDMMNPRRRRDRNSRGSKGEESENLMKVNIPEFDGNTLNPEGFVDWLVTVEEETDDQLVSRYIGGLRVKFMNSVDMFDPVTLSNAYQHALAFEKQNQQVGSSSSPAITRDGSGSSNVASHFVSNQARPGGGSGLKCFNWGEPGHRQSECKKAGKIALFAEPDEWEDDGVPNCWVIIYINPINLLTASFGVDAAMKLKEKH
nr:reverse transcriptase domain-containing protein [Tanacetum cinerariifolium]